ncbi:beta-glucanase (GH16 family) [Actinoplanes tereljensis]|uniref:GH16 domain-containing protein n=1 Tax=Paractinoplanes tereljensis TaxID=571912 RepID=A0A919NLD1_9ACTN|nr:glycoside hydrolase family 16 protein [Actinoplanes tereljensis]GIF20633.1 hypothetical protein Ate02nite_33630 [Actinoplanes tereljensis]
MLKRLAAIGAGLALVGALAACGPDAATDAAEPTFVTPSGVTASGAKSPASTAKPVKTVKWGDPIMEENFNGPLSSRWARYHTPDAKKSPRSRNHISVSDGLLHLTGGVDPNYGTDLGAGVMYLKDYKYGHFEIRFRVDAGAGYAVAILMWPKNNDDWPEAGEIDFIEINNPTRQTASGYVHHGKDNETVGIDSYQGDFTKFHTISADWLPDRITYYLDGKQVFNAVPSDLKSGLPDESVMNLAIQLDQGCRKFIPCRNDATPDKVVMDIDWVKIYKMPKNYKP